jgi:hypothetical protein
MANSENYKLGRFQRNHYFYGKLMAVRDFEVEQSYINEKRHLMTRVINGSGIVCGLADAEVYAEEGKVKIKFESGGLAIDCRGREIVVPAGTEKEVFVRDAQTKVNLTTVEVAAYAYYLHLEYETVYGEPVNSASNPSSCEETCCPNRVVEDFSVIAYRVKPTAPAVLCPDLSGELGEETALERIKEWFRKQTSRLCSVEEESGVFLVALEAKGTISVDAGETEKYLSFVHNAKLFARLLECHLSDFENPHKTDAAQVGALESIDGVSNPGGDVDLAADASITVTPDIDARTITIGETHSARTDNPHGTTMEQLGALQSVDGVSNPGGNVDLAADGAITVTPDNNAKTITIGETHSVITDNPHKVTAKQTGAITGVGGTINPGGQIDLVGGGSIKIETSGRLPEIFICDTHSFETGNPHKAKHADLEEVLGIREISITNFQLMGQDKHVSINDAAKWDNAVYGINQLKPDGAGNINIEAGENIKIESVKNQVTIHATGTGDGGVTNHSQLKLDDGTNPHQTKAQDVGALSIHGGTITGALTVNALDGDYDQGLHVLGYGQTAKFQSPGDEVHLVLTTKEGDDNRVHFVNRPGGRAAIRTNANVVPKDALSVLKNGNVGLTTEAPTNKLSVVAERAVEAPIEGNQVAAGFYGSPSADGRPVVIVNRGNPGESLNTGKFVGFYSHGKEVGSISGDGSGSLSYLPFTGSHLAWSNTKLKPNMLVSMTGENKRLLEELPASEPIYGVTLTKTRNDKKILGIVFSTSEPHIMVAAVGNYNMWVADKGDDIEVGDLLISSDVPGHAEKDAREDEYSYVIGRAAENVKWEEVETFTKVGRKKIKYKLITVLFGFYEKRNR